DSSEMPMAYCRLGDIKRHNGMYLPSANLYETALPMWDNKADTGLCHWHLAQDYAQLKDPKKADEHYKEALENLEDFWGSNSTNLVGPMLDYESFLEKQNRWIEAFRLKSRILDLIASAK